MLFLTEHRYGQLDCLWFPNTPEKKNKKTILRNKTGKALQEFTREAYSAYQWGWHMHQMYFPVHVICIWVEYTKAWIQVSCSFGCRRNAGLGSQNNTEEVCVHVRVKHQQTGCYMFWGYVSDKAQSGYIFFIKHL